MTSTATKQSVQTIDLSTLPERTHLYISLNHALYEGNEPHQLYFTYYVSIDGYSLGEDAVDGRVTISAKTSFVDSHRQTVSQMSRATIDSTLSVGEMVTLIQDGVTTELYVVEIGVTEPKPVHTIDLHALPAGSAVVVRSASMESTIFITGAAPSFKRTEDATPDIWAFVANMPVLEEGASSHYVPVERFVTVGERFGIKTKVLDAYVFDTTGY